MVGKSEPKPLPPHIDANMRDTFITTHDKEFTRKSFGPPLGEGSESENRSSGHISNRPIFGRPPVLDMSTMNQGHFQLRARPTDMSTLVPVACTPHEDRTAFVRDKSIVGIKWNEPPTITTMKASYTPKPTTAATAIAPFSGAATRQFNRTFLHIPSDPNEVDDVGKCKTVKRNPADGPARPHTQDGGVHPSRQALVHTPLGPGSYFQHSRLIGDQSLAYPSQLPKGLQASTESYLLQNGGTLDKRTILSALAGRTNAKGNPLPFGSRTNPIPMTATEQETCRVGHRLENEGWVSGTTYRTFFVKQQQLPELPDPTTGKKTVPVVPEAAPIRDSRGNLLPDRPSHVHPSVWNQLQLVERSTAVDKVDPHAHKMRAVSVR